MNRGHGRSAIRAAAPGTRVQRGPIDRVRIQFNPRQVHPRPYRVRNDASRDITLVTGDGRVTYQPGGRVNTRPVRFTKEVGDNGAALLIGRK